MTTLLQGSILDHVPVFNASVENDIVLFREKGDLCFTVDTGFTGSIALPQGVIDGMELELIGFENFMLATGDLVKLPMYVGTVRFAEQGEMQTWFIPGASLLGMEFLSSAGSALALNFNDQTVRLLR